MASSAERKRSSTISFVISSLSKLLKSQVPSNVPVHNQIIREENLKTSKYLAEINNWTEKNLMLLNQKKTKQIIFNFNRDKQFTSEIKLKQEPLEIVNEVKLLGVVITSDLKWHRNTEEIVKKANKRMLLLNKASKFTSQITDLTKIY